MAKSNGKNGKKGGTSEKILEILVVHKEGITVRQIIEKTSIPSRTVYNNLHKLMDAGIIKKVGTLIFCQFQSTHSKMAKSLKGDKVQLHDLSFVIRLVKKPHWWDRRENKLIKLGADDVRQIQRSNYRYAQIRQQNFYIQLHSDCMIFMAKNKFWGFNSWDCLEQATRDFMACYDYVEKLFDFQFFPNGIPNVSIRSQHMVLVKDALAEKCKSENKKFEVVIDGKRRMWVDMSDPFGTEAGHKDHAPSDMGRYHNVVSDVITKDSYLPSEVKSIIHSVLDIIKAHTDQIGQNALQHKIYGDNSVTHVALMDDIRKDNAESLELRKEDSKNSKVSADAAVDSARANKEMLELMRGFVKSQGKK